MAGRTRTKKQNPRKSQTNAATQTSPDKYLIEINRLREEANSLRLELLRLKPEQRSSSASQKQTEEVTVAVADSPQQKIPSKGCNCKGKCASRVCGCVKKQIACTSACKCTHEKCENKDNEKENVNGHNAQAQISPEVENNIKLMSKLKIQKKRVEKETEGAAGPSTNQPERAGSFGKSLFSPETPKTARNKVSSSNLQLNTPIQFVGVRERFDAVYNSSAQDGSTPEQDGSWLQFAPKSSAYGEPLANSGELNKKRLISPYRNGRKPRPDVLTENVLIKVHSSDPRTPVKKKVKAKNVEQVSTETASSRHRHSEQARQSSDSEELEFGIVNPMRPTRELQRTPVSVSSTGNQLVKSQSPSPFRKSVKTVERIITPVPSPEVIDEPVNWEEHYRQLVPCKKCKRTFFPDRIEKHESSCKP